MFPVFRRTSLIHFLLWRLGMAPAETQTSEAERDCLSKHASGKKNLAEIGVWHGVTTSRLRKAMAPDAELLAIDPFPKGNLGFSTQRVIARSEVGAIRNGSVQWCLMTGEQAGKQQSEEGQAGQFDFVFIDGDHSYEGLQADWERWKSLIAKDAVVALHDSHSTPSKSIENAGSVRFTSDVILQDDQFTVIDTVDTLTVLRRVA